MANALTERRIVRVLMHNDHLLQGLKLAEGTILCQIVPAIDRYDFGNRHWMFLAHPDFPVTEVGLLIPEYKAVCTPNESGGLDIELTPA